jgi:RNA polymerase sigma-70 factor, ECF subfamily
MHSVPPFNAALEAPPAQGAEGGAASFLSPREFEALYSAYFHHVTRWARAFGCPQADVDDVAQETFLVARRRLDQFQGGNAAGWLYRIAQHVTRGHRRRAWLRRVLHGNPEAAPTEARHSSPVEALEQREARRLMHALLSQLTERRRTTFFLFEIEGYSGEEIAQLEGVAVATVYTRLHHARRDFMNLLASAEGEEPRK